MTTVYTPEHDTAIQACYRAGGNVADVAARFGLNRNQIIGRANRIGAKHAKPRQPHNPRRGSQNPERDKAICKLVVAGWTQAAVAAVYGINQKRISQISRRHLKRTVVWEWRDA